MNRFGHLQQQHGGQSHYNESQGGGNESDSTTAGLNTFAVAESNWASVGDGVADVFSEDCIGTGAYTIGGVEESGRVTVLVHDHTTPVVGCGYC